MAQVNGPMLLVPCGDDPDDVQEGGLVSQILVFIRHTHMIGLLVLLVMASSVTCLTVAVRATTDNDYYCHSST